ncbi:MAG TPA: nuclease-related domain-containing protein [Lachnospiraceae bacterium]|nr:nuclease-related domain-containing protein [Lachnospiraceae bacterium]
MMIVLITVAIVIGILLLVLLFKGLESFDFTFESQKRRAGRRGEEIAANIIKGVLRPDDNIFTNVKFVFDGRPAELDAVVVNKFGVFIFEVKNYSGTLVGGEDDFEWQKYKMTDAGNIYTKTVKNPIKQVKRQVYLLANYLDYYGKKVWVDGYAILVQGNCSVHSNLVISSVTELDRVIHTHARNRLTQKDVNQIVNIIK